eukprot:715752_1
MATKDINISAARTAMAKEVARHRDDKLVVFETVPTDPSKVVNGVITPKNTSYVWSSEVARDWVKETFFVKNEKKNHTPPPQKKGTKRSKESGIGCTGSTPNRKRAKTQYTHDVIEQRQLKLNTKM